MGSQDHGVVYYDAPDWRWYEPANSDIPQAYVRCLALDPATGLIWGGTEQSGVFVLDPNVITAMDGSNPLAGMQVFPNPASDVVHFTRMVERVSLVDVQGKVVAQSEQANMLQTSHVLPGMYWLVAEAEGRVERIQVAILR